MVFPPLASIYFFSRGFRIFPLLYPLSPPFLFPKDLTVPVCRCDVTESNHSPESHSCFCFKEKPFCLCYIHFTEL